MLWRRDVRHLANAELQKRLALVRRQSAESEAWLDLVELALSESRDGAGWQDAAPGPQPERPVKTPLLFRAHLTVDRRVARRYMHRLLKRAGLGPRGLDALLLQPRPGARRPRTTAEATLSLGEP